MPGTPAKHRYEQQRNAKVIAAVACPRCGAQAGKPCRNPIQHQAMRGPQDHRAQHARPHNERRCAWVEAKHGPS